MKKLVLASTMLAGLALPAFAADCDITVGVVMELTGPAGEYGKAGGFVERQVARWSKQYLGDVEAGAYYRVNPRLRVGATAGLAEPEADPASPPQTERRAAPRFRLESIFRF